MKVIYLITGTTGEYSDHNEWTVRAFNNKQIAENYLNELANYVRGSELWDASKQRAFQNPLDLKCKMDYTGTRYYLEEIDYEEYPEK